MTLRMHSPFRIISPYLTEFASHAIAHLLQVSLQSCQLSSLPDRNQILVFDCHCLQSFEIEYKYLIVISDIWYIYCSLILQMIFRSCLSFSSSIFISNLGKNAASSIRNWFSEGFQKTARAHHVTGLSAAFNSSRMWMALAKSYINMDTFGHMILWQRLHECIANMKEDRSPMTDPNLLWQTIMSLSSFHCSVHTLQIHGLHGVAILPAPTRGERNDWNL